MKTNKVAFIFISSKQLPTYHIRVRMFRRSQLHWTAVHSFFIHFQRQQMLEIVFKFLDTISPLVLWAWGVGICWKSERGMRNCIKRICWIFIEHFCQPSFETGFFSDFCNRYTLIILYDSFTLLPSEENPSSPTNYE